MDADRNSSLHKMDMYQISVQTQTQKIQAD